MPRRYYSNLAQPTSLTSGVAEADTTISVPSTAGYPSTPFTIAIDRGNPNEEIVLVQGKSASQFTDCVRGYDSTAASNHLATISVEHVVAAIDYTEWSEHIYNTSLDHHTQYLTTARHAAIDHASIVGPFTVPVGGIIPYFGTASPDTARWLLCNGQSVSRSTYSTLFGVIGTAAGPGDGLSTFNVPNLRGRTIVGLDNMGGASANVVVDSQADILGGLMGTEAVTLATAQMPNHGHGAGSLQTTVGGDHAHQPTGGQWIITYSPSSIYMSNPGPGGFNQSITYHIMTSGGAHAHSITGTSGTSGGGAAHPNMQPSLAMAYLIRAA